MQNLSLCLFYRDISVTSDEYTYLPAIHSLFIEASNNSTESKISPKLFCPPETTINVLPALLIIFPQE